MWVNPDWLLFRPWPCAALQYAPFKHDLSSQWATILAQKDWMRAHLQIVQCPKHLQQIIVFEDQENN